MVAIPSLGTFGVAVVALLFAVWLLWQHASEKGERWRLWGAAISLDAALIGTVAFLQMNTSDADAVALYERLRYSGLLILVQCAALFAAGRLGRPAPVVIRLLGAVNAGLLLLTWLTPWAASGDVNLREFALVSRPYYDGVPGPLGLVVFGYVGAAATVMLTVWITRGRGTAGPCSRGRNAVAPAGQNRWTVAGPSACLFLAGFGFWTLLGFHDLAVKLGLFDGVSYLIEYGFVGFSAAVLVTASRDFSLVRRSLSASEARFRAILHASPHPMLALRPDGEVDYVNAALTKLLGCSRGGVHEAAQALVPSDILRRLKNRFCDEARRTEPLIFETSVAGCGGEQIDLEGSGTWMGIDQENIDGFVFVFTDTRGRKRAEMEMRRLAYQDPLTGLPNRTAFAEQLDQLLENSRRQSETEHWALLFLDLNDFKDINDRFGHAAGDTILERTAERLRSAIRRTDHCYRLGGDEFLVVVTHVGEDLEVAKVAEKLVRHISRPQRIGQDELRVGVSVGITLYPHDGTDRERLLANADIAMYAAKGDGKDYRFFTEEMNAAALRRMEIEHALPRTVEEGDIILHYQPIVGPNGGLVGAESLARWQHPSYGWVSPAEFIPIAERTGTIRELGYQVLEAALSQLKKWQEEHGISARVGVNLSARQFEDERMYERLEALLSRSGVDPSAVVLELTEGSVMRDPPRAIAGMKRLRRTGLRFALDDFGSGYSAFSYLNRLPIDILKIDRSFVVRATASEGDEKTLRTLVALAHDLGMRVVVEGVETAEQVALLRSMGEVRMQGFFFARPMPGNEIPKWAREMESAAPFGGAADAAGPTRRSAAGGSSAADGLPADDAGPAADVL